MDAWRRNRDAEVLAVLARLRPGARSSLPYQHSPVCGSRSRARCSFTGALPARLVSTGADSTGRARGDPRGEIDLAFRRWDRPRVKVGTRLRTAVGLLEVVSVDRVSLSSLRAEDGHRAGARSLSALKDALAAKSDRPIFRVGLRYAGADPRDALRESLPSLRSCTASSTHSTGSTPRRRSGPGRARHCALSTRTQRSGPPSWRRGWRDRHRSSSGTSASSRNAG